MGFESEPTLEAKPETLIRRIQVLRRVTGQGIDSKVTLLTQNPLQKATFGAKPANLTTRAAENSDVHAVVRIRGYQVSKQPPSS